MKSDISKDKENILFCILSTVKQKEKETNTVIRNLPVEWWYDDVLTDVMDNDADTIDHMNGCYGQKEQFR